jgi:hypothetical protein
MIKNLEMIKVVVDALGELKDQCVFVGGATTSFYIDDIAAPEPNASMDVDCVVEIKTYSEYSKLQVKLRTKGFKDIDPTDEDEDIPSCRMYLAGIKVDFMSPDKQALGFTNSWYKDGLKNKEEVELLEKDKIFIFELPYFIASKLEAFNHRGKDDLRDSQDLEDLSQVLDGRVNIENEILKFSPDVLDFVRKNFSNWLKEKELYREAISGYLAYDSVKTKRTNRILTIIGNIVKVDVG